MKQNQTRAGHLQRPGTTRVLGRSGAESVRRTVLPGGLRVVTEQVPGVRSASVGVWVGVGSRDETRPQAGAAHYLEHLLFKGTGRRSAVDIAEEVDAEETTIIQLSTEELGRRAAGRRSTEETAYQVSGDEDLARRVLDAYVLTP